MRHIGLRAALAAVALLATVTPARAAEVTTVGYSGDFAGYIVAVWRPAVAAPTTGEVYEGATKAECKWEGIGTSQTGVTGIFYGRVVTSSAQNRARPEEGVPVATAVVCRLKDVDDNVLHEWTALTPGSASAGVWVDDITEIHRPQLCVSAYVMFRDGTQADRPEACRAA